MVKNFTIILLACILLAGGAALAQQSPAPAYLPVQTTAYRPAVLYAGPGETFRQAGVLRAGNAVSIVERSRVGNWLRVQRTDRNGFVALDGWVMTGYLNLPPELRFSQVPANTDLPDADLTTVSSRSLAALYSVPVVSGVSEAMRQVFRLGQSLGNQAGVITKVGDSLTFNPMYLEPMQRADNDLGPYDYLADALRFFGGSASASVAAKGGLGTYVIFDPMWADKTLCKPNESALACEYRRRMPSVSFILFGPNDVLHTDRAKYTANLSRVVEETLARGIIPVLSTFSADPDYEYWWQAVELNLAVMDVAAQYETPLINLWAAARPLPAYGLDVDNIHMKNSGFLYLKFSTGGETWYGTSLRNLLSLWMLDEIYHTVIVESNV